MHTTVIIDTVTSLLNNIKKYYNWLNWSPRLQKI